MKTIFTALSIFLMTGIFAQTKFGVLVDPGKVANAGEHKTAVAKRLGITVMRNHVILTNPNDKPYSNTDFDLFTNINYGGVQQGDEKVPVPFPTDLNKYRQLLTNAVNNLKGKKPVVIAIENEEDNMQYHSGTAQDYLNELKAAIPIVHAAGIKVTNAGFTSRAIAYLVYQDLVKQGKQAEAQAYLKSTQLPIDKPGVAKKGDFAKQTLAAYKTMDIDYVNFHWYGKDNDASALKTTIEYLQRMTGKPIVTNEIGQYDNSPETVKAIVKTCRAEKMPYVIWYSALNRGPGKAVSLQNSDGTLKPNGEAFKQAATEQN